MLEVDINKLVNDNYHLGEYLPENIVIVGEIEIIYICYKYDKLDLFKVKCDKIYYYDQEGDSIENHILPNSLKILFCDGEKLTKIPKLPNSLKGLSCSCHKLTSLPDLPDSLEGLYCCYNKLTSFANTQLPNSLKELYCSGNKLTNIPQLSNSLIKLNCGLNKLTSIPKLPNLLQGLYCSGNQLTSLPNLPNSLKKLYCDHNQLISLPDFTHINHRLELSFIQDEPINYIPYNKNIKLYNEEDNRINIEGYPHNPITNQEELDKYMDYIKNYKMNRIKSARK